MKLQVEMEKLNEIKSGKCSPDQCPFPSQIMNLVVNKNISCLGDEKKEIKKVAKNIFSDPVVLVSVVATSVILSLIILIVMYCPWSRGSGRVTNSTSTAISTVKVTNST